MSEPGTGKEPGLFMVFSVADFAQPRNEDWSPDDPIVPPSSVQRVTPEPPAPLPPSPPPAKRESFRRQSDYMDHDYPEWLDDLPPWRNPDSRGDTYLYVWQQHQARIRGHH